MQNELRKIEEYLRESLELWDKNPDLVLSPKFFELWEEVHKPKPFNISSSSITLSDSIILLVDDEEKIGAFSWDGSEQCACLFVEGKRTRQKFCLIFEDGSPVF